MRTNIIIDSDSYKASHYLQYPPNTKFISSYIEARNGGKWDESVFFGLQYYLKEYLSHPITMNDIDEAEDIITAHGEPFNRAGWEHIVNKHGGRLPIHIEAVKEGTVLGTGNVLVQVKNTDPECYWLTSYVETSLLRTIWYATTVATNSYQCKKLIYDALVKSSDDPDGEIAFRLHDFGSRGVSSQESAGIGGMAHLINFMGTDTMTSLLYARKYYGERMAGFSIPASEHSSITTWGGIDGEVDAFRNMLVQFGGKGKVVACVSDSYDITRACTELWGTQLKEQVETMGGTLVVRPDSGDATKMPIQVINLLMEKFGHTVNSKGYKVLPSCIRVIQGDGIDHNSIKVICQNMLDAGLSMSNLSFGQGGGLLQQVNRDTLRFAMKASSIVIGEETHDVYKMPKSDCTKGSKRGELGLIMKDGKLTTVRREEVGDNRNYLETVFLNGEIMRTQTLADIRKLATL